MTIHMTTTEGKREQIDFDRSVDDTSVETSRDFSMHGERKDVNKIFLKLRIADSMGKFHTFLSSLSSFCIYFRRKTTLLKLPVFH